MKEGLKIEENKKKTNSENKEESVKEKSNGHYCKECGNWVSDKADVCPNCGVKQAKEPNGKSNVAAGLLALFLGGLGAHKFYMKKPGMGILYLVFVWTYIPAIVGLVEGIIYLTMDENSFNEKYID